MRVSLDTSRRWDRDVEHRAYSDLAVEPDLPTVKVDDLTGHRQTEAAPDDVGRGVANARLIAPEELAVELLRHPGPVVLHADLHVTRDGAAGHSNLSSPGRELDGIGDQDLQQLTQPGAVAIDRRQIWREIHDQAVTLALDSCVCDCVRNGGVEADLTDLQHAAASGDAVQVEHIVEHLIQPPRVVVHLRGV